ncbi:MAG: glycosyltransferase, partial [Candidatus Latescibacterota bacterium]
TFPLVVLEGMAAGLPVVATDVGSVREMMVDGDEGFIVSCDDDAALAERLLFLASSPDEGKRMGERGRARAVREFTVDAMISGYEALVRELVR